MSAHSYPFAEEEINERAQWHGELGPVLLSGKDYTDLLMIIRELRHELAEAREETHKYMRIFQRRGYNVTP